MAEPQRPLDLLLAEVAADLMGVSAADAVAATERTLERVGAQFQVDQAFLLRNQQQKGAPVLVAEWPRHELVAVPDTRVVVPFGNDLIFEMLPNLGQPMISYPDDSADRRTLVAAGSDLAESTLAVVPLLRNEETQGVVGLIRHHDRRWLDEEVESVVLIASLLAELWRRHDVEAHVAYLAYHDELTRLPNRRLLVERIDELDREADASLLIINVDNMRVINDGLNYEAGNEFLVELAKRLRGIVRSDNVVARLSGDQFGVLVVDSEDITVEAMAGRLLEELGRALEIGGIHVVRSVSIGVAHRRPSAAPGDCDLYKDADAALFDAKTSGKNRVAVFDQAIRQRLAAHLEMGRQLRQALDVGNQLCLHYQPEVDLLTGEIVAVEALLRWQHPSRGLLSAGTFIKLAEESGMIVDIGDYVLREAISQLAEWHKLHPGLIMRVNVSPAQLMSRDLAQQIRLLIAEHVVPAHQVCIEVTEHAMIIDHKFILEILDELRDMGVRIALDDFGTGYSSMEQLKRLPIDALKIDRAFIIELAMSNTDAAIVDATVRLAAALGMDVIAEGVEEEEQVLELLQRGCTRAQGFLLARPAASEVVGQLLGSRVKAGRLQLSEARSSLMTR